jgi:hypothetical protein
MVAVDKTMVEESGTLLYVISSADDPICNVNGIPYLGSFVSVHHNDLKEEMAQGPGDGLIIAVVEHGGHLGFAEDMFPVNTSWIDRLCVEWFDAVLATEQTLEREEEVEMERCCLKDVCGSSTSSSRSEATLLAFPSETFDTHPSMVPMACSPTRRKGLERIEAGLLLSANRDDAANRDNAKLEQKFFESPFESSTHDSPSPAPAPARLNMVTVSTGADCEDVSYPLLATHNGIVQLPAAAAYVMVSPSAKGQPHADVVEEPPILESETTTSDSASSIPQITIE